MIFHDPHSPPQINDPEHLVDPPASVWPRRTSKACAGCRRDKIRCDGARPCGACAKKGYSFNECTEGCEACRKARVRCEDSPVEPRLFSNGSMSDPAIRRACKRCTELRIECTDPTPIVAKSISPPPSKLLSGVVAAGVLSTKSSKSSERAKLACSSCRRDNKKCDDQRPCSRCIARGEDCIHIGRGPKLVKLRCEGCRLDNKRCEEQRPCSNCVQQDQECIMVPRKGRGHGTRVKAACSGCRRDKIRCNGEKPCAACVKKGCVCIERACTACTRAGKAVDCSHRIESHILPEKREEDASDVGGATLNGINAPESEPPPQDYRSGYTDVRSYSSPRWNQMAPYIIQPNQASPVPVYPTQQNLAASSAYYYYSNQANSRTVPVSGPPYPMESPRILPQSTSTATGPQYFFDTLDSTNHLDSYIKQMPSSSRTYLPDE